ncbi:hypothetical protein ACLJJ6_06085 [Pediococcus siamensis]|uniref:hypothetical protein n=1 Tax=Pediococcus siamensis TaxID=381829 RepID=UPI0039A23FD2
MQKMRLSRSNKKTILPIIMTALQTVTIWLVPMLFGHQLQTTIHHTVDNQILLILFVFMFNFLVFDRLTNKISSPIFLSMVGITIVIAALSFSRIAPTIGLLLFTSLATLIPFILPSKHNWTGWLSFVISVTFILPTALFYVQCGFLSASFLKILAVPLLANLFLFFPFFNLNFAYHTIFQLILGIISALGIVSLHLGTYGILGIGILMIAFLTEFFISQNQIRLCLATGLSLLFNLLFFL